MTTKVSRKIKHAKSLIADIMSKIEYSRLDDSFICQLDVRRGEKSRRWNKCYVLLAVIVLFLSGAIYVYHSYFSSEDCHLELPPSIKSLFRPPEDCNMCAGVHGAVRLSNITAKEFEEHYAYGTVPVIITDATKGWKAITDFNFKFFAEFYKDRKFGKKVNDCFFFPYKTEFRSLQEVFEMDEARANLSGDPWYVGWSTCHEQETRELRKYYSRPYFLPKTAESDMVDWIFMGGPGQGAALHLDSVRHMSWQAQVRGRKRWELAPPHECFLSCQWINFTVRESEIVVVDTNRWYHQTNVLPGGISITIGAEYD